MKTFALLALVVLCSGCAGIAQVIDAASCDPAIRGFTGFYAEAGIKADASGSGVPIPLPHITIGYGTLWRVMGDTVSITTGSSLDQIAGSNTASENKGMGSLVITASGVEGIKARCGKVEGK